MRGWKSEKVLSKIMEPVKFDLMTVNELSSYLKVKPGTIRCWICKKVIPIAKLGPGERGCVRFVRKEIDRWIQSNLRRERRITKRQLRSGI